MELAHRRNLLATGGGLVSSTFAEYKCFQFSVLSFGVEKKAVDLCCSQVGMVNLALANLCRANLDQQSWKTLEYLTWSSLCQIII